MPQENNNPQEILSQADIERLLAEVSEQQQSITVIRQGGKKDKVPIEAVQQHDFRQPSFMSANELRKLRLKHEDYAQALSARLSLYLRLECSFQLTRFQTMTFQKFTESITNPTHITLFKIQPLEGLCLLEIPPQLGGAIVDRMLGGQAQPAPVERDLSEIEIALLDQVIHIILNEWCAIWGDAVELRPMLAGHETNARFVSTGASDALALVIGLETHFGDCQETIQMGFPCLSLEPVIRQLGLTQELDSSGRLNNVKGDITWNPKLDNVKIKITAEWPGMEMLAGEIATLQPGMIIKIDPEAFNRIHVHIGSIPKFIGRVGTSSGKWAVELTEIIPS